MRLLQHKLNYFQENLEKNETPSTNHSINETSHKKAFRDFAEKIKLVLFCSQHFLFQLSPHASF